MVTDTLNKENVWLIGFIIDPDAETPQLYTIFFPGDIDKPLTNQGYILFFSDLQITTKAIKAGDIDYHNFIYPPTEVDLVCNIAELLYLINHETRDDSAIIVDCLNILFDMIRAIHINMPPNYQSILYAFADHLTFNQEFASFFTKQQTSATAISDALTWCIGAIVSKSKIITK